MARVTEKYFLTKLLYSFLSSSKGQEVMPCVNTSENAIDNTDTLHRIKRSTTFVEKKKGPSVLFPPDSRPKALRYA